MNLNHKFVHPSFRLNGISFSYEALKEVAYCLIKEGLPHEKPIGSFLLDWVNEDEYLEVATSGSTGVPKIINLRKQHMVNSAMATGDFFGLEGGNTALLCLPVDFIAGKMMLVRAMAIGLALDYVAPNSNPLESITKSYDFSAMIPLQLENSLQKLKQLKLLIVGGAKMSDSLKVAVTNNICKVYETYGMTETITHVALKPVNHLEDSTNTNFTALPKVEFSTDARGCLVINAPNISDEEVVTNDLVALVSSTEFEWIGRYDAIINSGGIKLFPEKIEAKISKVINVDFFVAGIYDTVLGQKLVLITEGNVDKAQLWNTLQNLDTLDKFEMPKEIYAVTSFIKTANGKIQRAKTVALISK
ncbi:AMP-binding protein [Cellulophaga baltica]|uniref:O-succinylbenzoic acid--CoA ligase n=1 Tax=Cellulophaga baltica 18 TaxID=1348584 RepID=A0AAU8RPF1_9FLAO|nr:AMP-binding protein [Cellulophaga baltica]AIZ42543.1 O-succinylbenzoic acid--CoA ligase [Cellulophaga baltica 18]